MENEKTFLVDFKMFVVNLLIGIGPLILFAELFIEQIASIFNVSTFSAFCLYVLIYFFGPIIILVSWILLFKQQLETSEDEKEITRSILFLSIMTFFSSVLGFFAPNFLMLILIIVPNFLAFGITYKKCLPLIKKVYENHEYKVMMAEFYTIVVVCLVVGGLYFFGNWKHIPLLDSWIARDNAAFNLSLKSNDEITEEWSQLISRTNFIGVLSLLSLLLATVAHWFFFNLKNLELKAKFLSSQKPILVEKKEEGFVILEKKEYHAHVGLKAFRFFVYLLVLLIFPVFQLIKTEKDKMHPFLNITGLLKVQIFHEYKYDTIGSDSARTDSIQYERIRNIVKHEVKSIKDSLAYSGATFHNVLLIHERMGSGGGPEVNSALWHGGRGKVIEKEDIKFNIK